MTTPDRSERLPADFESPAGTVMPRIRGRLRSRLPGPIRTARGQLIALAGYLLITPLVYAVIAIAGGLPKLNLSSADLAASTIGNIVVAVACILATRMLIARSQAGYALAVGIGVFVAGAGAWAISRIVSGQAGLAGDPAFYVVVYQGMFVVLGSAIAINLLRVFGEARKMAAETEVTSGTGLRVPLRDMRFFPAKRWRQHPRSRSSRDRLRPLPTSKLRSPAWPRRTLPFATRESRSSRSAD